MSIIPSSLSPSGGAGIDQRNQQQNQSVGTSDFDALLLSFGAGATAGTNSSPSMSSLDANNVATVSNSDPLFAFAEEFLENIANSLDNNFSAIMPQAPDPNAFPFSAAFVSTFGTGGPLPAYITMVTAELHLNATQNQALQDIAVENKDITKTPENIQKVAMELQQAGIGYGPMTA